MRARVVLFISLATVLTGAGFGITQAGQPQAPAYATLPPLAGENASHLGTADVSYAPVSQEPALDPQVYASLVRSIPHDDVSQSSDHASTRLANLLAAEQLAVIFTDDRYYTKYKHCAGKMNPLSGLPFARSINEELMAAAAMNITLRDDHHKKLLKWTMYAYPILERAVLGSVFHYWKAFRI